MQLENMRRGSGVNGVTYSADCSVCAGFYIERGGVKLIRFQVNKVNELNGWSYSAAHLRKEDVRNLERGMGKFLSESES